METISKTFISHVTGNPPENESLEELFDPLANIVCEGTPYTIKSQ